ncbi:MAG: hypothetical protein HYW24_01205 [Candidatus Aenigmarchaeota archaeon]|nr:hypothetical protein [Candidatus Aenigmarchaeota archaeon]
MPTLETLHKEIDEIKGNVEKILFILEDEGELTEEARKDLEEARKTPREEYISHEDVKKALMK